MKYVNRISILILALIVSVNVGCTPKDETKEQEQNNKNIWIEDTTVEGIKFGDFNDTDSSFSFVITNTKSTPQTVYSFDIQLVDSKGDFVDGFSVAIAKEFAPNESETFNFEPNAENISLATKAEITWEKEALPCGPWCEDENFDPTQDFDPSDYE